MYFETRFNGILIKGAKYKLPFTIDYYTELTNSTESLVKAASSVVFSKLAEFYKWEQVTFNTMSDNNEQMFYARDLVITKWTDGQTTYKLPIEIKISDDDIENDTVSDNVLYALAKYYKWERA